MSEKDGTFSIGRVMSNEKILIARAKSGYDARRVLR
jgi:hypothetical protein